MSNDDDPVVQSMMADLHAAYGVEEDVDIKIIEQVQPDSLGNALEALLTLQAAQQTMQQNPDGSYTHVFQSGWPEDEEPTDE